MKTFRFNPSAMRSALGQLKLVGALVIITTLPFLTAMKTQNNPDYPKVLRAIAEDITSLQSRFPQLKNFSLDANIKIENLAIDYGYHTHRARHRGGWTSGVPNPDADGVWFYINFHDPDSTAQIDTQPVTSAEGNCLGEKRITFLILEGPQTKPLGGEIWSILKKRGVQPCKEK